MPRPAAWGSASTLTAVYLYQMSDAKDHSGRDTQKSNGFLNYIYQPIRILPDPGDTRECLELVGLSQLWVRRETF